MDYKQEFDDIFRRHVLPGDPTIYINITSKTDPSDAPAGCENWFVLINAPHNRGQDWDAEVKKLRLRVIKRLNSELHINLETLFRFEACLPPPEIEKTTCSLHGSLYGISSNTPLAAFLRHPNRSKEYKGLYFCGGSVHPGGGMPLALLSGKIAAELVEKYE